MTMLKIGTTTLPLVGWLADPAKPEESQVRRLAAIREIVVEYGLSVVELTLDLGALFPQVFGYEFYTAVAELQEELGFRCTAHLPFLWVDPASLNEPLRRTSVDSLRGAVWRTRGVEVETYVLHLWGLVARQIAAQRWQPDQREIILGALMVQAEKSLAELCEIVEPEDLCVENLEDSLFELALPLVERAGASICLDVGHLASQGSDGLAFLARHRERIREVHLHDAVGSAAGRGVEPRDHLALGQGETDYLAFMQALQESGYNGTVILELNSRADLEESLGRLSS
jgi:sugar phosphate isomerase/epimerase